MSYDVVISQQSSAAGTTSIFCHQTARNLPEIHEPETVETPTSACSIGMVIEETVDGLGTCQQRAPSPSKKSELCTPSRSRGASSRLISAFTQFYGNEESAEGQPSQRTAAAGAAAAATDESFQGRMESKIMSMWHNVKYGCCPSLDHCLHFANGGYLCCAGWSGKMRSSFSKEQPVWLLGRCYHRKFSQPSSMESSAEMTASLENKLFITEQPQLDELMDPTVQEFGTDAIEGENQWEEGQLTEKLISAASILF